MNDPALFASGLNFSYDSNPVLQQVHLDIQCGELIGIIGPNGGGKTTLLKLLMGFLLPTSGKLKIFGKTPFDARLQIGYVPQIHRLDKEFPLTVWDLV